MRSIYDEPLTLKNIVYTFENVLKLSFPLVYLLTNTFYTDIVAYSVCILVIIRQLKPNFSKQFFALLIYNEYFQNMILTIPYYFCGQKGSIYYSIFAFHFIIGIAEYVYLVQKTPYKLLKGTVDSIRKNKQRVMMLKNYIELLLLLVEMILVIYDLKQLIIVVFYCNYIRIKYYFNENLQLVISEIDVYLKENFEKPDSPKVFQYLIRFGRMIVARLRVSNA